VEVELIMVNDRPESRTAVVTGATGGIGRATVAALLAEGLEVWAATRTAAGAEELRGEFGSRIRTITFDVTDQQAVREAGARIVAAGPLFALVNIAGAALPGPLEYVPIEQFQRQLDINVTGQLRVTQELLPALRAGRRVWGEARIVMMGSLDARIVGPLFGPYAASKHALVGLSDALRSELRPAGIRVALLEPGVIATPIWRRGTGVLGELQPDLPDHGGPYRSIMNFARKYVPRISDHGTSPDRVAEAVTQALTDRWPAPRRVVGLDAKIVATALHLLPPRLIHRLTALPRIGSARRR
jgi:NAD(P)-dependent dehydrogenase (short-subunit alcohol dehydrogenase family)